MTTYRVNWGTESLIVSAGTENDAWAAFAQANDVAMRRPKLYEREIMEVDLTEAQPVVEPEPIVVTPELPPVE
jgi:hypothetical protein